MIHKFKFVILFFFLSVGLSHGQDVIYLKDKSLRRGKIINLSVGKVRFKIQENLNGPDYVIDPSLVSFIFLSSGQYLIYPNDNPVVFNNFKLENDLIFTSENSIIEAKIIEENNKKIRFENINIPDGPVYTKSITGIQLVLYKSGEHKFFIDPIDARYILEKHEKDLFVNYSDTSENEALASNDFHTSDIIKNEKIVDQLNPDSIIVNSVNKYTENRDSRIEDFSYEIYEKRALEKTKQLGSYISLIADKSTTSENVDNAINQAVGLFIDEKSLVEVSNVNSGSKVQYPVRTYLTRLKLLPYDKIEISWSKISYVSDLKKASDGKYYGIITIQQKFSGFLENNVVYEDITQKNITVMVDLYDKIIDGEVKKYWEVFLSEIGVVQTRV